MSEHFEIVHDDLPADRVSDAVRDIEAAYAQRERRPQVRACHVPCASFWCDEMVICRGGGVSLRRAAHRLETSEW